jgi:type IV secretory pathway VirB2 component (pilin)
MCVLKPDDLFPKYSLAVVEQPRGQTFAIVSTFALAAPAFARANSPWENAVNVLQQAFTSTIARGSSLVAIVVSGLLFVFDAGGSVFSLEQG